MMDWWIYHHYSVYVNGSCILDHLMPLHAQDAICFVHTFPRFCPAVAEQSPTCTALHIKGLRVCVGSMDVLLTETITEVLSVLLIVVIYVNQFLQIYNGSSLLYTLITELAIVATLATIWEERSVLSSVCLLSAVSVTLATTYTCCVKGLHSRDGWQRIVFITVRKSSLLFLHILHVYKTFNDYVLNKVHCELIFRK